jgi:hypothetical protein
MARGMKFLPASVLCFFILITGAATVHGQDTDYSDILAPGLPPEVLIVLDLSGSMNQTVHGEYMYAPLRAGASTPPTSQDIQNACYDGPYYPPSAAPERSVKCEQYATYNGATHYFKWGDANCGGPFYKESGEGHTRRCDRLMLAKSAIYSILDANGDGKLDANDEEILGIHFGYIRFVGCTLAARTEDGNNYNTGCVTIRKDIPTSYNDLYTNGIALETATGLTPLALSIDEARLYLDDSWGKNQYENCPDKYILLVTDGWDTVTCADWSDETLYKNRKATVKAALRARMEGKNGGYRTFVIGFGAGFPEHLKNTLNWTAKYGGTDNPLVDKSGNPNAVQITMDTEACADDTTNDPGNSPLSGYAYLAENADDLKESLLSIFRGIADASYSFAAPSVASGRTKDDNFLYQGSFKPAKRDPFWAGYLTKYAINEDGSIGSVQWEAGAKLQAADAGSRKILTYKGSLIEFKNGNLTAGDLGVATDPEKEAIVGYFRGEPAYNPENWKLGDTLHSNLLTIASPSLYFSDTYDNNSPSAYAQFREQQKSRDHLVVFGANDGQFHAFSGKALAGGERWSFIPPNLLAKLQYLAHKTHPVGTAQCKENWCHHYFVDGSVIAGDVWLGADWKDKKEYEWKTLLIFGLREGVRDWSLDPGFLWSSSESCDSGFSKSPSATYSYYCGYYAFDVTDTGSDPIFQWTVKPSSAQAPYFGEPWSRMALGKVKISGQEKWVGLMGGGFSNQAASSNAGKGFFVVDLANGNVRWGFTKANHASMGEIPASPAVFDSDGDSFIDRAFVGDLTGNLWKFKFCSKNDDSTCGERTNWSGSLFFQNPAVVPNIYTAPAVAVDSVGSVWVFWGTGDKEDPMKKGYPTNSFYAVKDRDPAVPYTRADLENITSRISASASAKGWYIDLVGGDGEKMISDPTVYGGAVLFTTFTPVSDASDPCRYAGVAKLYALAMMPLTIDGVEYAPGAGLLAGGARSVTLGSGIPSAPIVSQNPYGGTNLYITISGGGKQKSELISDKSLALEKTPLGKILSISPGANVIHWRDTRVK